MDRILIVDDDADIRRAFRRNLELSELKISEAGDGAEAIRQVAAERELIVRALGETGGNQLQAAAGTELIRGVEEGSTTSGSH